MDEKITVLVDNFRFYLRGDIVDAVNELCVKGFDIIEVDNSIKTIIARVKGRA